MEFGVWSPNLPVWNGLGDHPGPLAEIPERPLTLKKKKKYT